PPRIAQFTRSRGKSGTRRFDPWCSQITTTHVLSQVSGLNHLGTLKRMVHTSLAKMFVERMILEMESRFRDQLIGHLIAEFSRYRINTRLLLIRKFRLRASIDFQRSRWIVKRSYCRKMNSIGRIRMPWHGTSRRYSTDLLSESFDLALGMPAPPDELRDKKRLTASVLMFAPVPVSGE